MMGGHTTDGRTNGWIVLGFYVVVCGNIDWIGLDLAQTRRCTVNGRTISCNTSPGRTRNPTSMTDDEWTEHSPGACTYCKKLKVSTLPSIHFSPFLSLSPFLVFCFSAFLLFCFSSVLVFSFSCFLRLGSLGSVWIGFGFVRFGFGLVWKEGVCFRKPLSTRSRSCVRIRSRVWLCAPISYSLYPARGWEEGGRKEGGGPLFAVRCLLPRGVILWVDCAL